MSGLSSGSSLTVERGPDTADAIPQPQITVRATNAFDARAAQAKIAAVHDQKAAWDGIQGMPDSEVKIAQENALLRGLTDKGVDRDDARNLLKLRPSELESGKNTLAAEVQRLEGK